MANANISVIAVTNTFDEWRTRTNDLIVDRNILRNHPYVKDNSNFTIANGAVVIDRSGGGTLLTVGSGGDAIVGGTTTTSDLIVGDDASVANQLSVTGNTVITGNLAVSKNTTISQNANVTGTLNVVSRLDVVGNTQLFSNLTVSQNSTLSGTLGVTGNTTLSSNLAVSKNTTISQNLAVTGTADVTGVTTLGNTLDVTGNTALSSNLSVSKNTAISQNLAVTGTAAVTGATTLSNTLDVTGNTTLSSNLAVSKNTTISQNLAVTGTAAVTGAVTLSNTLDVTGNTTLSSNLAVSKNATVSQNATISGTANVTGDFKVGSDRFNVTASSGDTTVAGDLTVSGGDITSTATANLVNTTTTTLNFGGAATTLNMGASSGTTDVKNNLNVTGDLDVDGGDITSTTTANLLNTTTTTLNFGGAVTALNMGAAAGTVTAAGDLVVSGGDITSTATANLLNTTTTTLNLGGAATTVEIGAASGTTNINNNLDVDGDVNIDGGDLTVSTSAFNLANTTATTVNFAGAATQLTMGSLVGTTNVRNDLNVVGDIDVDGGDLTGPATFNLGNTSTTALNVGGAAANVVLGSPTGTVNVRNQLYVTDNVYIPQGKNLFAYYIQTSSTESFYIERGNGVFKNLSVSGTFTLSQPSVTTSDRIILNEVPTAARDGYFTVRRGSATANASVQWSETLGVWRAGGSDATLNTIITIANVVDSFTSTSLVNVPTANSVRWALASGTFGGTLKAYKDSITEDTNVTGSKTVDLSVSNWYKLTLTSTAGNRQITFTNAPTSGTGFTVTLVILQDGTGSKTPTWANTIYWAGGQVPPATTSASARDLWTFTTYDGGTSYIGTLAVKDAR